MLATAGIKVRSSHLSTISTASASIGTVGGAAAPLIEAKKFAGAMDVRNEAPRLRVVRLK